MFENTTSYQTVDAAQMQAEAQAYLNRPLISPELAGLCRELVRLETKIAQQAQIINSLVAQVTECQTKHGKAENGLVVDKQVIREVADKIGGRRA